ncbi:MAG TPA: hypothetical protein G4O12_03040 [Dehalococcoidia bacterium]|nr:hypothetical protein [Dehalococcoidia bacterium]
MDSLAWSVAYWSPWLILLLVAWTLPWKGVALWRAAGNKHLWWFVALFLLNTLAILEIVYIFGFSKRREPTPETA